MIYPLTRTTYPVCGTEINQSNPITDKLSACQPFNEYTGAPIEIISQTIPYVSFGSGYWYIDGMFFSGTTIDTGVNVQAGTKDFTFMFYGYCNIYDTVLLCSCNNYGESGFTIVSNSTNGLVQVRINDESAQQQTALYPTTYTPRSQIVGVIDQPYLKLYIDGAEKDTVNIDGAGSIVNSTSVKIGSRNYSYGMTGLVSGVMLQNRALTSSEILSMYENPYQIYDMDIIYTNSKSKPTSQRTFRPLAYNDKFDRVDLFATGSWDTTSLNYEMTEPV